MNGHLCDNDVRLLLSETEMSKMVSLLSSSQTGGAEQLVQGCFSVAGVRVRSGSGQGQVQTCYTLIAGQEFLMEIQNNWKLF